MRETGVLEQDVKKKAEDFQRKMEEAKRKAFEAEVLRVDKETGERAKELSKMIRAKDEHLYNEQLKEAEDSRLLEEEQLKKVETDIHTKLAEEQRKKEARRREEKRLREEESYQKQQDELKQRELELDKKAEEERSRLEAEAKRQAEENRLHLEEEARQKADAERRRLEEEAIRKAEEERVRLEAEAREKAEEERHRLESAARRKGDEERQRQEDQLRQQREEFMRREEERKKKEEQRRIDTDRRRAEEETRRKEEEARRKAEEEVRKKEEEERRIREEAERKVREEEEKKHKLEEELRRQVEARQRKEAEAIQKKAEEKQRQREEQVLKERIDREARILELITNAERLLSENNPKHALVEVAKALVNDPKNATAIQLEGQIKEILETIEPKKKAVPKAQKDAAAKKKVAAPKLSSTTLQRKKLTKQMVALICVGLAVLGALVYFQAKDRLFPRSATLTILPWTSVSNSPEETIVGSSLAEEVVNQFQRSKRAHVMGYASAYGLTQYAANATQAMFSLGYPYVLKGTLTKSPIAYTANLKLVDSTGSVIWAQQYDKSVAELPDLPVIVATDLAKFLRVSLDEPLSGSSVQRASKNSDAYAFYLRGLELLHRHTGPSTENALQLFQQAIELDENFSVALAAAASSIVMMRTEGWNMNDSLMLKAHEYADKAIRANGAIADGYLALGKVLAQNKEYKPALEQFAAAIRYAPNNSDSYLHRGTLYVKAGKYKEAIDDLTRAYELNPREASILQTLGYAYSLSGSPQQSVWYHQTALYFTGDSSTYIAGPLCDALLFDPMYSLSESGRILAIYKQRIEINPKDYVSLYRLARLLQVTGQRIDGSSFFEKAEKTLREELQAHPKNGDAMVYLGLTLTRLGKFPEAIALAQKANDVAQLSPVLKYKIAQIYSLQMYSAQKKKTDDKKKDEALKALREAVALHFDFDQLADADFFNMYAQPEFHAAIQEPVQ